MYENGKLVTSNVQGKTHMSASLVAKMRNTENLENGLSVGSKNRLKSYQENLCVSRGVEKPLFDDQLVDILYKYVYDKSKFNEALNYLNQLTDNDGFLFSRDLKIYENCQDAFERFADDDHPSFRWNENYQKSLKFWEDYFKHLRPKKPLRYHSDEDIISAIPKEDTHSGYTFIQTGVKEKGGNLDGIFKKYLSEKKEVIESKSFSKPVLIGFRTQASGEFEDDGSQTGKCKHKLRVVSMIDLMQIIFELQFAKPIQDLFADIPEYAGGKEDTHIGKIIMANRCLFPKYMSIDYSAFDQTISSWLIKDAFSVLKSIFRNSMTPEEETLWEIVINDFIHKDFVLNEGILHSDKGVPSGSMFTQIVGTMVNLIVIMTYFISIKENCKMMAMGDDNIIFCTNNVQIETLATYIQKNFGLVVKIDEKSNQGPTSQEPKFLSRYWSFRGAWRHPNQLISRMAFPERYRDYSQDVKPEHVIYAFVLTYSRGMAQLMDVVQFKHDYPSLTKKLILEKVDSRYVPGALAYIRDYTMKRVKSRA